MCPRYALVMTRNVQRVSGSPATRTILRVREGHNFAGAGGRVTFLRVRVEMTRSPAEHP